MRKFLSIPRELRSVLCELTSIIHQLRWFLGFAVLGFGWWASASLLQLGDALARPVLSVIQLVAGVALLTSALKIFFERASTAVKRIAAILANVALTSAALLYVIVTSVRDYESAAALWGLLIGLVLLAHATSGRLDYDFGGIIRVGAAPLYWVVCFGGFFLALGLYPLPGGEVLLWRVAMVILAVGLWTLPYPQWVKARIERFRWNRV